MKRQHSFLLTVVSSAILCGAAPAAPASPFLEQVKTNFPVWDRDKDGSLSIHEIEQAVNNPEMKGEAAAAAAAIRRAARATKGLAPLSMEKISAAVPYKADAEPKQPNYERLFNISNTKIKSAKRVLFAEEPKLDSVGQGRLGDCFLLASLGAVTYNQPERLKQMMTPTADGKVKVKFGDGETVELPLPTDAEFAIGASSRNTGLWANMYETAMGHLYIRNRLDKYPTPYSYIGGGGSPATPLKWLTGKKIVRMGCEDFQRGKLDEATTKVRLDAIRTALLDQKKHNRLTVGGTGPISGKQVKVPGLYYNHSYAVLDYDAATDTVLFWNPMGNRYTPKGQEGLKYGYKTSYGRFKVPLPEAVMWFGSFSLETDEPATVTVAQAK